MKLNEVLGVVYGDEVIKPLADTDLTSAENCMRVCNEIYELLKSIESVIAAALGSTLGTYTIPKGAQSTYHVTLNRSLNLLKKTMMGLLKQEEGQDYKRDLVEEFAIDMYEVRKETCRITSGLSGVIGKIRSESEKFGKRNVKMINSQLSKCKVIYNGIQRRMLDAVRQPVNKTVCGKFALMRAIVKSGKITARTTKMFDLGNSRAEAVWASGGAEVMPELIINEWRDATSFFVTAIFKIKDNREKLMMGKIYTPGMSKFHGYIKDLDMQIARLVSADHVESMSTEYVGHNPSRQEMENIESQLISMAGESHDMNKRVEAFIKYKNLLRDRIKEVLQHGHDRAGEMWSSEVEICLLRIFRAVGFFSGDVKPVLAMSSFSRILMGPYGCCYHWGSMNLVGPNMPGAACRKILLDCGYIFLGNMMIDRDRHVFLITEGKDFNHAVPIVRSVQLGKGYIREAGEKTAIGLVPGDTYGKVLGVSRMTELMTEEISEGKINELGMVGLLCNNLSVLNNSREEDDVLMDVIEASRRDKLCDEWYFSGMVASEELLLAWTQETMEKLKGAAVHSGLGAELSNIGKKAIEAQGAISPGGEKPVALAMIMLSVRLSVRKHKETTAPSCNSAERSTVEIGETIVGEPSSGEGDEVDAMSNDVTGLHGKVNKESVKGKKADRNSSEEKDQNILSEIRDSEWARLVLGQILHSCIESMNQCDGIGDLVEMSAEERRVSGLVSKMVDIEMGTGDVFVVERSLCMLAKRVYAGLKCKGIMLYEETGHKPWNEVCVLDQQIVIVDQRLRKSKADIDHRKKKKIKNSKEDGNGGDELGMQAPKHSIEQVKREEEGAIGVKRRRQCDALDKDVEGQKGTNHDLIGTHRTKERARTCSCLIDNDCDYLGRSKDREKGDLSKSPVRPNNMCIMHHKGCRGNVQRSNKSVVRKRKYRPDRYTAKYKRQAEKKRIKVERAVKSRKKGNRIEGRKTKHRRMRMRWFIQKRKGKYLTNRMVIEVARLHKRVIMRYRGYKSERRVEKVTPGYRRLKYIKLLIGRYENKELIKLFRRLRCVLIMESHSRNKSCV